MRGPVAGVGDHTHPFTIQSVAKPFLFALVCEALGHREVRVRLGVNATGLPFDSVMAVEISADGLTNPLVNSGAIATTSLVPGHTADLQWDFLRPKGCPVSPAASSSSTRWCSTPSVRRTAATRRWRC